MTYLRASVLARAETALRTAPLGSRNAIAAACGVSAITLSRAIMEVHGQRFREWRQRVALAGAKSLVTDLARPRSLKEVATELGFGSPASFTRWFHQQTGLTPTAYRAQHGAMSTGTEAGLQQASGTSLAGGATSSPCASIAAPGAARAVTYDLATPTGRRLAWLTSRDRTCPSPAAAGAC